MRLLMLLLLFVLTPWPLGAAAQVSVCEELTVPSNLDRWPLNEEQQRIAEGVRGRPWAENRARLLRLKHMLRRDAAGDGKSPLLQLAAFVHDVTRRYDGSAAKASELAVSEVTPSVCGANPLTAPCAWKILNGRVQMPFATGESCPAAQQLAGYVHTLAKILGELHAPHVADAARDLALYDQQWQRLVMNGYSQYPWEVWLNGLLGASEGWGPSKNQLIVAHAFAGIGVGNLGGKHGGESFPAAILGLEALGYLRYVADFRAHFGVGLAGVSPNLTWSHRGWGPALHLSGISLGYSYGVLSDDEHTVYMIIDVTRGIDDGLLGEAAQRSFKKYVYAQ